MSSALEGIFRNGVDKQPLDTRCLYKVLVALYGHLHDQQNIKSEALHRIISA